MWYNRFNLLAESRKETRSRFIDTFMNRYNNQWQEEDLRTFIEDEFNNNVEDINWILKTTLEKVGFKSMKIIKVLMENGIELQVLNDLGQTALHIAAKKGDELIVRLLFEYSGDENHIDDEGFSYLHAACMYGLDEVVQRFINKGANINVKTFYKKRRNKSPLSICIKKGFFSTLKILLNNGADLKLLDDWNEDFLKYLKSMEKLARWEDIRTAEIVANHYFEKLLRSKVIKNSSDAEGFTHLHAACICGNIGMVQKFIDQKDDLIWEMNEWHKESPLTLAVQYKRIEIVEMLLKNGSDPNMKFLGKNPLHAFFDHFDNNPADSGILELLLVYKCDVNARDYLHRSPLFCCYESCNRRTHDHGEQCFLAGTCYKEGCLPDDKVMINKWLGDLKNLETLLKNKANVNETLYERTILHNFVASNVCDTDKHTIGLSMLKVLLKYGADINAKDGCGNSPLHIAALYFNLDVVKLLLRHGADAQSVDLSKLHLKRYEWRIPSIWLDEMIKFFLIIDCLYSKGYDMDESSCLAVMKYLITEVDIDELQFAWDPKLFTGSSEQISLFLRCAESKSRNYPFYTCVQKIVSEFYRDLLIVEKGNMFIKAEMKDCLQQLQKMFVLKEEYVLEYSSKIPEQIEKLKKLKIKYGLSLFDVCSFGSETGHYLLTNPKLWRVIISRKFQKEFCYLSNTIQTHMLGCLMRKLSLDIGLKHVLLLTQDKLPLLCCEKINQNLSNDDILYLCRVLTNKFLSIEFQYIAENVLAINEIYYQTPECVC